MNKKNKVNGILNVDTEQMEKMRQAVVEQELSARSWKAYYEKMYYSMEAEKLETPYKEYQERTRLRLEEDRKKMEEFMASLNTEIAAVNETDPKGEVKLEAIEGGA